MFSIKKVLCLLLVLLLPTGSCAQAAAQGFTNPFLNPNGTMTEAVDVKEKVLTFLLIGIEFGPQGYRGTGNKNHLEECHADAALVLTVHLDTGKADMISIPRDTLVYVPGVRGIYKFNGAINCGMGDVDRGLQMTRDAASWLLGGIKIDYYIAIDMEVMIEIGETIGGVDFAVEMPYVGNSGRHYEKGMTHLDGIGIMDYLRSRRIDKEGGSDLGRINRQRELMLAIFAKIMNQKTLFLKLAQKLVTMENVFTNVSPVALLQVANVVFNNGEKGITSHVITGEFQWGLTFTNAKTRREVIKKVYGVSVPDLEYASVQYVKWLGETGFFAVRHLTMVRQLLDYLHSVSESFTAEHQGYVWELEGIYHTAAQAFEEAAKSMKKANIKKMDSALATLREAAWTHAAYVGYPEDRLPWEVVAQDWRLDAYINEAVFDWF